MAAPSDGWEVARAPVADVAAHIASWHPLVTCLVADSWDAVADGIERRGVTARITPAERAVTAACTAYLGEGT